MTGRNLIMSLKIGRIKSPESIRNCFCIILNIYR